MFYAGKGDKTHTQKIVQQTTTDDYDSWENAADVVASQFQTDRPSSPSVAKVNSWLFRDTSLVLLGTDSKQQVHYRLPIWVT